MTEPVTKTFTVFHGSSEGKIVEKTTTRTVGPLEVLVRTTHSGLCFTDCHVKHQGIGLGHEGVGIVEAIGTGCKKVKIGDVVGWGYIHDTCGTCQQCLSGNEIFCTERQYYQANNLDQGSLSTHGVWLESFVYLIPRKLTPAHAAPLMCGGATVFTPLYAHSVKPTHTVGIAGIGGLGHLAIQFASKMGCRVIAFSRSESKREEAMRLGAHMFICTTGKTELASELGVGTKLDVLMTTTNVQPDWNMYLGVMKMCSKIFPLGIAEGNLEMPYVPMVLCGLSVIGSVVANRHVHVEMLEFAARHGIKPTIETFPMSVEGIEAAYKKLEDGTIRHKAVIVVKD